MRNEHQFFFIFHHVVFYVILVCADVTQTVLSQASLSNTRPLAQPSTPSPAPQSLCAQNGRPGQGMANATPRKKNIFLQHSPGWNLSSSYCSSAKLQSPSKDEDQPAVPVPKGVDGCPQNGWNSGKNLESAIYQDCREIM